MSNPSSRLGDLQLRILKVLWRQPGSSVTTVQAGLTGGPLAYTTVATMLRKMEDRQLVTHEVDGRRFLYRALVTPDEVSRNMAGTLVDRLFDGSVAATVHHLLETREIEPQELDRLAALIQQHRHR